MSASPGSWRAVLGTLALGFLAAPLVAVAGPPYATDDPVPTDRGHWETYLFAAGARAGGAFGGEGGIDVNYGAAENLQLTAVLPAAYQTGPQRAGSGTAELAAKYRVRRATEGDPGLELAIFPRVFLPTARSGLGPARANLLLPLWAERDAGAWSVFGGDGYQFNPGAGQRDFWTAGMALTRTVGERLAVGAELTRRGATTFEGAALTALTIGATLRVHEHWSLLVSAGSGLRHARDEGQSGFYLALKADY